MPNDIVQTGLEVSQLEMEAVAFFETLQTAGSSGAKDAGVSYGSAKFVLGIPPLGEGDKGLVYPIKSTSLSLPGSTGKICLKVAKQQQVCRDLLLEETKSTEFFLSEQIAVPRIHYMDPLGRFAIKDWIEGESITSLYMRFNSLSVQAQSLILKRLEQFLNRLLELFEKRPDCKVSISPNNIYVLTKEDKFSDKTQFVLIDPGPVLKKNYQGFNFNKYWNEVLPDRIRKYQQVGYLQWLVPRQVTQAERDQAKEFEIFRSLAPSEIFLLLKIAKTVEFDVEEVILREGAVGENFYLILDGEVEGRKGHYTKPGAFIPRMRRGSVLGELAFLLQVPRSMTVVAATPCKLIEIDRDQFHEMLEAELTAPYKLVRNISTILAERLYNLNNAYQKLLESQQDTSGTERQE